MALELSKFRRTARSSNRMIAVRDMAGSRNKVIVFAVDTFVWHVAPQAFEGMVLLDTTDSSCRRVIHAEGIS